MDDKPFDELLASVREGGKLRRGARRAAREFRVKVAPIVALRARTGLSQAKFAELLGVSRRTLENWEQGRRHPSGPAVALLKILAADPESALRALRREHPDDEAAA